MYEANDNRSFEVERDSSTVLLKTHSGNKTPLIHEQMVFEIEEETFEKKLMGKTMPIPSTKESTNQK
jgi:hypothetical protein